MVQERLEIIDNMSATLRRIAAEAARTTKFIEKLKNIRQIAPDLIDSKKISRSQFELNYMGRQFDKILNQRTKLIALQQKEMANEQRLNQLRLNARRMAADVGVDRGVFSYSGYRLSNDLKLLYKGEKISDSDLMRWQSYYNASISRRNRMMYDSGRVVNGLTFEQRAAMRGYDGHKYSQAVGGLQSFIGAVASAVTVMWSLQYAINSVIEVAKRAVEVQDKMVGITTRLALTNDGSMTTNQRVQSLVDMANRTRAPMDSVLNLYNRIATSGVKASNDRIQRFVETFNKTMVLSGTSAQENRAVMLQLAQGMGSNRLGGDEFRSIAEQAPIFKYMLAKGLGVGPGELKQMGAEGKLTADAIMTAMEKTQEFIDKIFENAPMTIGQIATQIQNKWTMALNRNKDAYMLLQKEMLRISKWMSSKEADELFTQFFRVLADILKFVIELSKILHPFLIFVLKNMKYVFMVLTLVGMKALPLISTGFKSIGVTGAASFTALLSPINAVVASLWAAWLIGTKLRQLLEKKYEVNMETGDFLEEQEKYQKDKYLAEKMGQEFGQKFKNSNDAWVWANQGTAKANHKIKIGGKEVNAIDRYRQLKQDFEKVQQDARQTTLDIHRANSARYKQQTDPLNLITGMMNTLNNTTMKGVGHVGSVGKIENDVTLDNDSIEMLKMVAERQWINQNEVTVPQQVTINIDEPGDALDAQSLSIAINKASQLAVASSMRGEYANT